MRIVLTTDQIHTHGGIEKVTATKANYWVEKNHEVIILTTDQKNQPPCYPLHDNVKIIDLDVNYDRAVSYFTIGNLRKARLHFRRQRRLFRLLRPDFIISPGLTFDYYWLPFIAGNARLIKERHSSRYNDPLLRANATALKKLRFFIDDWIDRRYDAIVVLNKDEYSHVRNKKGVIINNPITDSLQCRGSERKMRVLAAGRFLPVKGFDKLIRAWSIIHEREPGWHLDIFGQNHLGYREELLSLIDDLQLSHVIHLNESVSDLPKLMCEYSLYAMTSETECFPMVLLEAFSAGLPVVSFDCPYGPRNIITNNADGLLVPQGDIPAFANALLKIMKSPSQLLEMSKVAKNSSKRYLTREVMGDWDRLFETLSEGSIDIS